MARLKDRIAVVTGSSSGIGQGIAIRFAQEGARVVVNYIGHPDGADQTLDAIQKVGGEGIICQADVTVMDDIRKLIDAAWQTWGGCDILVNNAGMEKEAAFWNVTEADYDKVLAVNLKGPFFLTQYFVQKLLAANKPGRIINISSVHEDMVFPHFSTYCVSKGGIRMLMRDLAVELGPKNITVNNIAPGRHQHAHQREICSTTRLSSTRCSRTFRWVGWDPWKMWQPWRPFWPRTRLPTSQVLLTLSMAVSSGITTSSNR